MAASMKLRPALASGGIRALPCGCAKTRGSKVATIDEVVRWMQSEVLSRRSLDQERASHLIRKLFGDEFTYRNKNENWAIRKDVLAAFRALTGDSVIWDRSYREWRQRRPTDKPGRQQD
jgi:hypothetical protein